MCAKFHEDQIIVRGSRLVTMKVDGQTDGPMDKKDRQTDGQTDGRRD